MEGALTIDNRSTLISMLKRERQNFILDYLALHGTVKVPVICEILGVSHDTIGRDLRELAQQAKLTHVHGGAIGIHTQPPQSPATPQQLIAQKAIVLLEGKRFILTSGGDAMMELYPYIPSTFNATLLTVSMEIASKFSEHPLMEVIQIGDRVQKPSKLAVGSEAITKIRQVRADICMLDALAIDSERGLTEYDWPIAHVKMAMAENADVIACLALSSVLGNVFPIQACRAQRITYLVTELDPQDPVLGPYRDSGMIVM